MSNVFRSLKYAIAPVSFTPMRAFAGSASWAQRPIFTCCSWMPRAELATSSIVQSSRTASAPANAVASSGAITRSRRFTYVPSSPRTRARHASPMSQPVANGQR